MNNDSQEMNNAIINLSVVVEQLVDVFTNCKTNEKQDIVKLIIEYKDMSTLLVILSERNLEEIAIYIIDNFSISDPRNNNPTALFDDYNEVYFNCIKKNQIQILEALINNQCISFPHILDNEGNNGLIIATIYSNMHIAKLLLKQCHALLEMKNKQGIDALTVSVYNNDNLMFFLLANNLTHTVLNTYDLCKLAIRNENMEILSYLTNNKSNRSRIVFIEDETLLHYACCQTNLNIFNHIASLSTKFDLQLGEEKEIPLHWAVMKSNYHIVKAMLVIMRDRHIDVDSKTKHGYTPFFLSIIRQDKNISELLYDFGANANENDNEGNSIAHILCATGDLEWLKYVAKHFNVNCFQKNNKGNTPFVTAILNGHYSIVEYFIEGFKASKMASNLNWKNKYGQTPLHAAVFANEIKIIELLLRNKADITISDIVNNYLYNGKTNIE